MLAGSRGSRDLLQRAMRLLTGPLRCERILFLGEAYADLDGLLDGAAEKPTAAAEPPAPTSSIDSDADFLAAVTEFVAARDEQEKASGAEPTTEIEPGFEGVPVVRVPERGCPAYEDPAVGVKQIDMIGTTLTLAVHHKGDLVKEDIANAVLIFHGGSDEPGLVQIGPRAFMTPGRLSAPSPAVAVFESAEGAMHFEAFDLDGQQLQNKPLQLRRTTKFSLK